MPSIGQTTRPGYVYDSATDTWIPIGIGPHTHASTDLSGVIANSIVDAKADLITATADNTPARLAAGNNGESLVVDSSTATGLRWQEPKTVNGIINSNFSVWQRGTSFSLASFGLYTADRWNFASGTNSGRTVSRQATGDTTNLPNIQYCARVQRNNGNSTATLEFLQYNLESVDSIAYAGKTVTLSFYARRGANFSAASNNLGVVLVTGTGTDQTAVGGFTGAINAINTTATLTTTWQRFTYTATLSSSLNQIGFYFQYNSVGTAGAADYFEVTGVQLEVGSVATAYRPYSSTIAGELAACQRYYSRLTGASNAGAVLIPQGIAGGGTVADFFMIFPVPLRTAASSIDFANLGVYNVRSGSTVSGGTWSIATSFSHGIMVRYTHGSSVFTANDTTLIVSATSASTFLGFSAEL